MADDSWSTVQWERYSSTVASAPVTAWRKERVPYKPHANALQTLDVWIADPRDNGTSKTDTPPAATSLPAQKGPWIVYIHGGAWRDPMITASSFAPTVDHLLGRPDVADKIGGMASISYSLSSHPSHPTNPSEPGDSSRSAKHPDHITDVITALSFLQQKAGFGENYMLIGHSCGATLALQVAMNSTKWSAGQGSLPSFKKPKIVVGLNGLYDMPGLISDAGPKHEHLAQLYEAFTRMAFGDDTSVWRTISPVSVDDWSAEWPNGSMVVLAQSKDDSLVPYRQTEAMQAALKRSSASTLQIREAKASGDHNEIWQEGKELAEIVRDTLPALQ